MKQRLTSILLILFLFGNLVAQTSGTCLIQNIHIVDIKNQQIIENQDVIIQDNRISLIEASRKRETADFSQRIDGEGQYLIPGMWDMHAHPDDPEVWRMNPIPDKRDLMMPLFVLNGVTGIRDMAGSLEVVKHWRNLSKEGKLLVPEIFAGGPLLDGPNPMWDGSIGIDSPDAVPQVVDSLISEGVDFLKVYSLLPRDTYFALSAYAKKIDFPFVGHVPFTVTPTEAAETGMKSQEHLLEIMKECAGEPDKATWEKINAVENRIDRSVMANTYRLDHFDEKKAEALYDLYVEKEIWHCPTLSMWYKNAWYESELEKDADLVALLPEYLRTYWTPKHNDHLRYRSHTGFIQMKQKLHYKYLEMTRKMHQKGVLLLAGTDTGANPLCHPGVGVHNELALLVEAGLKPGEALKTATLNPAIFLEIEADYGSVEMGKIADLVILGANPLEDIQNVKKIAGVIKDGNYLDSKMIQVEKEKIRNAQNNK